LVEQGYGGSFGSGKLNAVNDGSNPIEPPEVDDGDKPPAAQPIGALKCGAT
jgi:hypothetical protein